MVGGGEQVGHILVRLHFNAVFFGKLGYLIQNNLSFQGCVADGHDRFEVKTALESAAHFVDALVSCICRADDVEACLGKQKSVLSKLRHIQHLVAEDAD